MTQFDFTLPEDLKKRMVQKIVYDPDAHVIIIKYKRKSIRVFTYPEYPEKTMKIFDEEVDGTMNQETKELIKSTVSDQWHEYIYNYKDMSHGNGDENGEAEKKKQTKAELVLEVTKQHCVKLFVDEYQVPHAAILVEDHSEILPLSSRRFRNWVARILYNEENIVIDSNTLKDSIGVLSARAVFDSGDPIKLNLRVAQHKEPIVYGDNKATNSSNLKLVWYYDLTNKDWEFIEITSDGWNKVKSNDLILFRRFNNQMAQVYPSKEYSPDIFDRFIKLLFTSNIKDEDNRKDYELLLKCYIVSLFIPEIPKVVLMPHGHQGSAKSTMMESIKMSVDPSVIKTLSFPRDKNELIQQMSHNFVTLYDNVSTLSKWISDEICRAVTGSGSSKRVLYSDDDDFIYNLKRCVGINGINLAATSPDLLDRGLNFELKRIEDKDNKKIEDVEGKVEEMTPQLLGYILDILVKVLKFKETNPDFKLDKYPRMADFAEYGEIISRCMGFEDNEFLGAYGRNIKAQTDDIIDSSQIATCLMYMMFTKYGEENEKYDDYRTEWKGSPSALLGELNNVAQTEDLKIDIRGKYWPKIAGVLSRRLNELGPTLKETGLEIEFLKNQGPKRGRIIKIRKISSTSSTSYQDQDQTQNTTEKGDDDS